MLGGHGEAEPKCVRAREALPFFQLGKAREPPGAWLWAPMSAQALLRLVLSSPPGTNLGAR